MTAKPDLLPLRDCMECLGEANAEDIRDYARANISIATAAKDAEVEALRAEVERLTFEMGRLRQQYDERTACMIVHRSTALACSDAVRAAYSEEHHRAERLAEACDRLIAKWERQADEHGVRQFTGNDHKLFANELRAAIDQARGKAGGEVEGG